MTATNTSARQRGLATVEFAICGGVLLVLMFGIVEFGRIIFTLNVLDEGARRAARVAAICPVNDPKIISIARLVSLPGTQPSVAVEYLNAAGAVLASPGTNFPQIASVRVRLYGYTMPLAIPFLNLTFTAPQFSSSLPSESLGVVCNAVSCISTAC
jgi:hypothetical protein